MQNNDTGLTPEQQESAEIEQRLLQELREALEATIDRRDAELARVTKERDALRAVVEAVRIEAADFEHTASEIGKDTYSETFAYGEQTAYIRAAAAIGTILGAANVKPD